MKRVAKGVYKRSSGYDVRATALGHTQFRSFPKDAKLGAMRQWQEDTRAAIRRADSRPATGTFAADAAGYLELPSVKALTGYANVEHQVNFWVERFGSRKRHTITPDDVRAGIEALVAKGYAPGTQKGYVDALQRMWSKLDGRSRYCPVKDVDKPSEGALPVRTIPPDVLAQILAALPQPYSKSSARILVFAATGLSSATQQRIDPSDIDLERGTITVPPRRKGRGVAGRVLPLTHEGVGAFRVWLEVGAQGKFNNSALANAFKVACRKAGTKVYRLYDLRHAFVTQAVTAFGPVAAMGLAMHSNITTTMRYANGAVQPAMQSAVDAMNLASQSSNRGIPQQIH